MSTTKQIVVARLTAMRETGDRTIIEVHADATFQQFYRYYSQNGLKRSTKKGIRIANRNDGLPYMNAHLHQPGLEILQKRLEAMQQFKSVKVRIIQKRAYKQLINAAPDVLGMAKITTVNLAHNARRTLPMRSPKAIPSGAWLAELKLKQAQVTQ